MVEESGGESIRMVEESGGESIRMVVENPPASLAPVDKPRGGGRPGHRKKPQERLSAVRRLEDARDSRGRQGRFFELGKGI